CRSLARALTGSPPRKATGRLLGSKRRAAAIFCGEGLEGLVFGFVELGDFVQTDDVRADANLRIQSAELDRAAIITGTVDQVAEDVEWCNEQIRGSRQIDQELLRPVLAGYQVELTGEFLALGRKSEFLAQDLDDGDVADHVRLDMLKVSGGHDCGASFDLV